jgi:hypothetical protein
MANHVRQVLTFKHLNQADIFTILDKITSQTEGESYPLNCYIDFDKIIPEPRLESECPDDCIVNKSSHVEEDKDRPWFDWYKWHLKYWGTKWGAYDTYTKIGKSQLTFVYSTAWSIPVPILFKILNLGYDFVFRYADESYGSNCGIWKYTASEHNLDQKDSDFHTLANPDEFAIKLWEKY